MIVSAYCYIPSYYTTGCCISKICSILQYVSAVCVSSPFYILKSSSLVKKDVQENPASFIAQIKFRIVGIWSSIICDNSAPCAHFKGQYFYFEIVLQRNLIQFASCTYMRGITTENAIFLNPIRRCCLKCECDYNILLEIFYCRKQTMLRQYGLGRINLDMLVRCETPLPPQCTQKVVCAFRALLSLQN